MTDEEFWNQPFPSSLVQRGTRAGAGVCCAHANNPKKRPSFYGRVKITRTERNENYDSMFYYCGRCGDYGVEYITDKTPVYYDDLRKVDPAVLKYFKENLNWEIEQVPFG